MTPISQTWYKLLIACAFVELLVTACSPNMNSSQDQAVKIQEAAKSSSQTAQATLRELPLADSKKPGKITYSNQNKAAQLQAKKIETRQQEARQYVGAITRAEQSFQLVQNRFTSKMDELKVNIKSAAEDYEYSIPVATQMQAKVRATAKKPGLKSYTGAVFVVKDKTLGESLTATVICETNQPSPTPPAMPRPPQSSVGRINCPAGSSQSSGSES